MCYVASFAWQVILLVNYTLCCQLYVMLPDKQSCWSSVIMPASYHDAWQIILPCTIYVMLLVFCDVFRQVILLVVRILCHQLSVTLPNKSDPFFTLPILSSAHHPFSHTIIYICLKNRCVCYQPLDISPGRCLNVRLLLYVVVFVRVGRVMLWWLPDTYRLFINVPVACIS